MHKKIPFSAIIRLMRPKQWIKNLFVLAPLIFSGTFTEWASIQQSLTVFFIFCLTASATYILNDYIDIESDQKHPVKSKKRPLASGEVTKYQALILMVLLYGAIIGSLWFYPGIITVITAYLVLNIAYTFCLKHQPVLDIFTIAAGFVLRVYAGTVALGVPLSSWMFITTLSLALYLAAIKRRQELAGSGKDTRKVLQYYTINLIDKYAEVSAVCAILFYSLFVISDKPEMVCTIPFVLFGIYRYWFIIELKGGGESPADVLFMDTQLQLTIISWVIICGYLLS